jgi:hypothetical protein
MLVRIEYAGPEIDAETGHDKQIHGAQDIQAKQ